MTERAPQCTRCRTEMETGYMLDRGHGNSPNLAQWVEGAPEKHRVLGLWFGLKTKDRDVLEVSTWRCPRCGLLESYAR